MLEQAVSLLPVALQDKAKTVVAVVGGVAGAVVQAWPGHPGWVEPALAGLTALGVYAVPNVKATIIGKA